MTQPSTEGAFRRLWPDDRAEYAAHLHRLAPGDQRRRFLRGMSPAALDRHAARIADPTYFVCGWTTDGAVRGVVEVAADTDGAEAALSVEEPWRSRGLGRALLGIGLRRARLIGQPRLRVLTTRDNVPMLRIARTLGAEFQDFGGEILGTITSAPGTITELLFDATENNAGLLASGLDLIGDSARALFGRSDAGAAGDGCATTLHPAATGGTPGPCRTSRST